LEIWAAGVVLLLLRLIASGFAGYRLVRSSSVVSTYGRYTVRTAPSISSPVAWSFGRSAILVPPDFAEWPAELQEAALRHEVAHLDRADSQALFVAELARAIYWAHPLVWYALYRLKLEQERAADDAAIGSGLAPTNYASQLVAIAKHGATAPLFAGAASPGILTRRIETILENKRRRTVRTRRMVLGAAASVIATLIPLAVLQADDTIYKVGGDVTPPRVVKKQEPGYTNEAREAKVEGTILLSLVIEADGTTSNIAVKRGLGYGLDEKAKEAVGTWRFKPAQRKGEPVRASATVAVNFRLL
jgi:TonB family protein